MRAPGEISTSTVSVATELSLSTSWKFLLACISKRSAISERSTTRSPGCNTTSAILRRSDASPRSTSITRTASRLKIGTSLTFMPTSVESSGMATSVKYFICRRPPRKPASEVRFGNSLRPMVAK